MKVSNSDILGLYYQHLWTKLCKGKGQSSKSALPAICHKKVTKGLQIVGWNEYNFS